MLRIGLIRVSRRVSDEIFFTRRYSLNARQSQFTSVYIIAGDVYSIIFFF